jgi:hypothetical protein
MMDTIENMKVPVLCVPLYAVIHFLAGKNCQYMWSRHIKGLLLIILLLSNSMLVLGQVTGPSTAWPPLSIRDGLGVSAHWRGKVDEAGATIEPFPIKVMERAMGQIVDMGLKIVRIGNCWQWKDKSKGEYDFSLQRQIVNACEQRGLRVVTQLEFADPRYEKSHSIVTEEGRRSYARFCASIVKEFKGKGVIWEMWNEPNGPTFWQAPIGAADYFIVIAAAMKAMRDADPNCIIIAPSVCTFDWNFLDDFFKYGLKYGFLEYVSAVSIHPYGYGPEVQLPEYLRLRDMINTYNKATGKKVFIVCSEWGYSRVSLDFGEKHIRTQDEQGALVARSILVSLMVGTPMHIVYQNLDFHEDNRLENIEAHYGLLTVDEKPKSAYQAVKTLIRQLGDLKFESQLLTGSVNSFEIQVGDYVALFSGKSRGVVVAWTTSHPHEALVQLPGLPAAMVDMKDNAKPIPPLVAGITPLVVADSEAQPLKFVQLRLTSEPVYIEVKP